MRAVAHTPLCTRQFHCLHRRCSPPCRLACRTLHATPPQGSAEQAKFGGEAGTEWPAPGDRVVVRESGRPGVVVRVHGATQLDVLTPLEVQLEGAHNGDTARLALDEVTQPETDTAYAPAATDTPQQQAGTTVDADRGGLDVQGNAQPSLIVGANADAVRTMRARRPYPLEPPPGKPHGKSFAALAYGKLLPLWALDIVSSQVCSAQCLCTRSERSKKDLVPKKVAPAAQGVVRRLLSVHPPAERPGLSGSTPAVVLGAVAVAVFQAVYVVYDLIKEAGGAPTEGQRGRAVDALVLSAICTALLCTWLGW